MIFVNKVITYDKPATPPLPHEGGVGAAGAGMAG